MKGVIKMMKHILNLRGDDLIETIENTIVAVFAVVFGSGLIYLYMNIL
jgi:hypothetical protein